MLQAIPHRSKSFFCQLYRTFLPATRQPSFTRRRINPAVRFFDTNKRVISVFLDPKLNSKMAPRTAKAKKTSSIKAVENGAPKKGKAIAKAVEEPGIDEEMADEVPVTEKKTKRSKKADGDNNGSEETNGVDAQPSKKGKKNKPAPAQKEPNSDKYAEDNTNPKQDIEEEIENGHSEEVPAKGKKTTKKELATSKSKLDSKTSSRGKKNAKQEIEKEEEEEVVEKDEAIEEKPKTAGKGRTRKVPQKADKEVDPEEKNESGEEEIKTEPSKGRKRGPAKPNKEKTPESEQDVQEENDRPAEEPKKKETKGKKNQVKKSKQTENGDEGEEKHEPATKKRKVTKKDKKDEMEHEEDPSEEATSEPKPAKGKRGLKKVVEVAADADEAQATGDAAVKRRRKAADEKVSAEDTKKKAPPKNKSTTDYENIDFSNTSKNVQRKEWNLKIASWNVDGIRAWMSKGGLDYIKYEKPDILCLQETKCAKEKLPDEIANLPGYHAYWQGSDQEGYAGVGIYTTKLAMNVQYGLQNEELDSEGRIITAEYEQFYLICTYVPNAGRKLVTLPKRLQWNEEFRKYVKALNAKKPVIICGDMNVAHNEIDLSNPKSNKKNAGFTAEERAGMTELLGDGLVDTYRHLRPHQTGAYTFWTYMMNSRAKNVGWRLDYFLMSERLMPALCDSVIRNEVYGSDHCPIVIYLHITSADKPKE